MSSPPYPDVFIEPSVTLSSHEKLALLTERWDAQEFKFPTRFVFYSPKNINKTAQILTH